ncbi:Lysophosphatidylcholine acyltransferase 2 [Trichoplax sp. H2]|nr:Lysophosphatidylcholine acyltransferase 2 [Trichoplax sp. H2]|eukprot:RDD47169.1 Lysophosphatidylcholine acyltransferase 2 [Trichoplax sp. H2]
MGPPKSLSRPIVRNPFNYGGFKNLTLAQKIEFILTGIFLGPIRLILILIILCFAGIMSSIVLYNRGKNTEKAPLIGWRRTFKDFFYCQVARSILFVIGFYKIKVNGKLADRQQAPIIVIAPHSSFQDMLFMDSLRPLSGLSRVENKSAPILGPTLIMMETIFVSRMNPKSHQQTIDEILKRSTDTEYDWPQMMIFPEGTGTNRKSLVHFKAGAFIPGVPIQLVAVRFLNKVDTYSWVADGPGPLMLLIHCVCQFRHEAIVDILPVYHPTEEEKKNPRIYADNVRKLFSDFLSMPTTEHTYEDCCLMVEASKTSLPLECGIIEYRKINVELGLNYPIIKNHLKIFSVINTSKSGKVTIQDLASFLNVNTSDLEGVFALLDMDEDGYLDFREYLIGITILKDSDQLKNIVTHMGQTMLVQRYDSNLSEEDFRSVILRLYPQLSNEPIKAFYMYLRQKYEFVSIETVKNFLLSDHGYNTLLKICNNSRG